MANIKFYQTARERELQHGHIPDLSHDLESTRRFQWELVFNSPVSEGPIPNGLTLGAKQVTPIGMTMEKITADRVNDKFHYPGKSNTEEMTVTFDNLVLGDISSALYEWYATIYDPRTGFFTKNFKEGAGHFKVNCQLFELGNERQPIKHTHLYGVFPTSYKQTERNYATNEFHTLEMTFSYDFLVQESTPNG